MASCPPGASSVTPNGAPSACIAAGTASPLLPYKIVFFGEWTIRAGARTVPVQRAVAAADRPLARDSVSQHDLADHLRNQHHADVFSETFVRAKAEIEVV